MLQHHMEVVHNLSKSYIHVVVWDKINKKNASPGVLQDTVFRNDPDGEYHVDDQVLFTVIIAYLICYFYCCIKCEIYLLS